MNLRLNLSLKNTIHRPRIISLWDLMDWEDRLQFQAITIVKHYPHLEHQIWSMHLNNDGGNDGNFDNFDDLI